MRIKVELKQLPAIDHFRWQHLALRPSPLAPPTEGLGLSSSVGAPTGGVGRVVG